ncbi:hypothetical protein GCM10007079_32280 [Nocardiopsis terrae]|nr:hypothetical protein GCM10007079_32280 [Nocardiopsis terrae]
MSTPAPGHTRTTQGGGLRSRSLQTGTVLGEPPCERTLGFRKGRWTLLNSADRPPLWFVLSDRILRIPMSSFCEMRYRHDGMTPHRPATANPMRHTHRPPLWNWQENSVHRVLSSSH